MALEALTGHIDVMRETGETIPDPSSLDEVMSNHQFQDGVAFLVSVNERGKRYAPTQSCSSALIISLLLITKDIHNAN